VEGLGLKPRLVLGSTTNIKVTFPEDLAIVELILKNRGLSTAKLNARNKNLTEPPRRQDAKKNLRTNRRKQR
jgi:hypothetical protein